MGFWSDIKERLNPATIAAEAYQAFENRVSHGAAEAASALFQGHAYVPYGQGSGVIEPGHTPEVQLSDISPLYDPKLDWAEVDRAELGNLSPGPTPGDDPYRDRGISR